MSSLGWALLPAFLWPMKMTKTKANQETAHAKHAGWQGRTGSRIGARAIRQRGGPQLRERKVCRALPWEIFCEHPELASNDTGLTSNNLNGSLYELHSALKLSASAANKAGGPGTYPREKFSLTHPLDCWKTPHFGEFTIKEAEHHD